LLTIPNLWGYSLGVCLPREVLAVIGGLLGGVARVPPSHVLRSSGLAAKNNAVYLTGAPAEYATSCPQLQTHVVLSV
jgi:hypothetical protein